MLFNPADVANTNAKARLGEPVETFVAYDRATGGEIEVDERTFNEAFHSRTPIESEEPPTT